MDVEPGFGGELCCAPKMKGAETFAVTFERLMGSNSEFTDGLESNNELEFPMLSEARCDVIGDCEGDGDAEECNLPSS